MLKIDPTAAPPPSWDTFMDAIQNHPTLQWEEIPVAHSPSSPALLAQLGLHFPSPLSLEPILFPPIQFLPTDLPEQLHQVATHTTALFQQYVEQNLPTLTQNLLIPSPTSFPRPPG